MIDVAVRLRQPPHFYRDGTLAPVLPMRLIIPDARVSSHVVHDTGNRYCALVHTVVQHVVGPLPEAEGAVDGDTFNGHYHRGDDGAPGALQHV